MRAHGYEESTRGGMQVTPANELEQRKLQIRQQRRNVLKRQLAGEFSGMSPPYRLINTNWLSSQLTK